MKLTRMPTVAPLALAAALSGCGEKEVIPPHAPPDSSADDSASDDSAADDSASDDSSADDSSGDDTYQPPHPHPDDTAEAR
ncbi:MAG: hypothetical protein H6741_34970 [Alphaproteobacteria bacterium]|nr:hypothetical protein [Alphaproteobacteria bacterium]